MFMLCILTTFYLIRIRTKHHRRGIGFYYRIGFHFISIEGEAEEETTIEGKAGKIGDAKRPHPNDRFQRSHNLSLSILPMYN